jgi:hypothetical protein
MLDHVSPSKIQTLTTKKNYFSWNVGLPVLDCRHSEIGPTLFILKRV